MADITNQDLKELILSMDKKMEVGFANLGGEIKRVDKRVSNEEIVSRGASITIFGGSVAGVVKYFFFS